jgi:hypothetical protein
MFSVVQFTCTYTVYMLNINKLGYVEITIYGTYALFSCLKNHVTQLKVYRA